MSEQSRQGGELVLLTGATGYVGGRLLGALRDAGRRVRCMTRRPDELAARLGDDVEVVQGDVLDPATLGPALEGVTAAYYLIHSMGSGEEYERQDREAAANFARAARDAGIERILYLGGLGGDGPLSKHLRSRQEVGGILRESGVPTIEFRASIIIGSGSLSFEMIRSLVRRLPVMTTPRWVRNRAQPIAVEDVIAYLVEALDTPINGSAVYEIGGPDGVSYGELMRECARQRGLRRLIIPVPVLSPGLSSLWLGLITPLYARVGRQLIEGIRYETVVTDDAAMRTFSVKPRGYREAIARALSNEDQQFAATRWSDALSSSPSPRRSGWGGERFGTRLVDRRQLSSHVSSERVFAAIERIGGRTGWYYGDWLWRLRGLIDEAVGGAGHRRGRRDPDRLQPGDTVDWWRVEAIERSRLLRLRAEMRLPGRGWLQFEVQPATSGCEVHQTAIFDPEGLLGLAYWYALWPIHSFVFAGMIRGISRAAEDG